jgi:hypothetical protein
VLADKPGATRSGRVELLVAALVCLIALARLVLVSKDQLASPFDLMYESPNLGTVRVIESGRSPYDPVVYAGSSFTLTPYTPLYFYALAALPEAPARPFLVARLLSLASIVLCALVLAVWSRRATAALLAVGLFLLAWPVTAYASYLRMDPPALALSALCLLALHRPTARRVELAAVLAVLAVATKQTFVAAGLAGALQLWVLDRRLALRFLAVALASGAALAALATLLWGRGFWFSIFVLRSSPVRLQTLWAQAQVQLVAPIFVLLLLAAAATALPALRREGAAALRRSPALAYLLASTAVLLATLGKEGSSSVYFLELALALPLWLTDPDAAPLAAPRLRGAFLALLLAALALDLGTWEQHRSVHGFEPNSEERPGPYYAAVRGRLAEAGFAAPRLLNLGPPRFAYAIADDICMNDVSTYDQAYEQGALDPAPLLEAIRARAFDVVAVTRFARAASAEGRPMKAAIDAVRESYRLLWTDSVASYFGR